MEKFVNSTSFKYLLFLLAIICMLATIGFESKQEIGQAIGFAILGGSLIIAFTLILVSDRKKS